MTYKSINYEVLSAFAQRAGSLKLSAPVIYQAIHFSYNRL